MCVIRRLGSDPVTVNTTRRLETAVGGVSADGELGSRIQRMGGVARYQCPARAGRSTDSSSSDERLGSLGLSTGTIFPDWCGSFVQDEDFASRMLTTSASYVSYTPTRQPHGRNRLERPRRIRISSCLDRRVPQKVTSGRHRLSCSVSASAARAPWWTPRRRESPRTNRREHAPQAGCVLRTAGSEPLQTSRFRSTHADRS